MRVRLYGDKHVNKTTSHEEGVIGAVNGKAVEIGARAEALLNTVPKHRTGQSEIKVEQAKTDSYVILNDEAAMSIEFGHWLTAYGEQTGKFVPGLYILHNAAGI